MLSIMWHHLLSKSDLFVLHSAQFISALDIVPRPVSPIDSSPPHPADSHQFKNELVSSGEFEITTRKRMILLSPSVLKCAGPQEVLTFSQCSWGLWESVISE